MLEYKDLTRKEILQKAKRVKNDEFYTRYEDIEKELSMYDKKIWEDKVIFCNCDDAVGDSEQNISAFALYFIQNFNKLSLKELICTHYSNATDLSNQWRGGYVYTLIFKKYSFAEQKQYPIGYTGRFADPLSLKILNEEADIVCTNPPFSMSRDYWKILIGSGKKFLIISNITNTKNQPYMSYFLNNQVWAGYNSVNNYLNSSKQIIKSAGHWYTNLPVTNTPKSKNLEIISLKKIPSNYKQYDDAKMLLVSKNYIPNDYKKPFAVSVRQILNGLLEKGYKYVQDKEYVPYIDGKRKFGRILVQKVEKNKKEI